MGRLLARALGRLKGLLPMPIRDHVTPILHAAVSGMRYFGSRPAMNVMTGVAAAIAPSSDTYPMLVRNP